ncbi:unnamed protein product [Lepidochelys kempii]
MFGKHNSFFPVFYYSTFPWDEYSVQQDVIFCFPCYHFHSETAYVDDTLIKKGVRDWMTISEKLSKHAVSQVHVKCMEKWQCFKHRKGTGSVAVKLSASHKSTNERNWDYLTKDFKASIPQFQELPYHREKENYFEKCRSEEGWSDMWKKIMEFC